MRILIRTHGIAPTSFATGLLLFLSGDDYAHTHVLIQTTVIVVFQNDFLSGYGYGDSDPDTWNSGLRYITVTTEQYSFGKQSLGYIMNSGLITSEKVRSNIFEVQHV